MEEKINRNLTSLMANNLSLKINQISCKDSYDFSKMKIGIEIVLINMTKFITISLISILVGTWIDSFVVFISFAFLRKYTYGLHATSSLTCTLFMCVTHILTPMVVKTIYLPKSVMLLSFGILLFGIYKYAPSDTRKLPLLNAKKRKLMKKKAFEHGLMVVVIALIIPYPTISNTLLFSMMYVIIMILPISYKIFKERRNNYEYYE